MSGLINTRGIVWTGYATAYLQKKNHVPPIIRPMHPIIHDAGYPPDGG
jgi:hypothetical protein